MSKKEFGIVLAYLSAGVGKPINEDQAVVYFDILGKLDYTLFQEAAQAALRGLEANFLPSPGVLWRLACDIDQKRRGERDKQARLRDDQANLEHSPEVRRLLEGIGRPFQRKEES